MVLARELNTVKTLGQAGCIKIFPVPIFYSLLFAMGGAPTIAMLLILLQKHDPNIMYQAFIGLSVIFACILVPLVLIQNAYLFYKRKNPALEEKMEVVSQMYLGLKYLLSGVLDFLSVCSIKAVFRSLLLDVQSYTALRLFT